jgi:hypothetical protein
MPETYHGAEPDLTTDVSCSGDQLDRPTQDDYQRASTGLAGAVDSANSTGVWTGVAYSP